MIRNPLRKSPQVGGGSYGDTQSYNGFGGCATGGPYKPSVIGNAGLPGCGTATSPGQECGLRVLFVKSASIAASAAATVEVLAGRGGAYKPRAAYMVGVSTADPSVNARVEITNITVMGDPQLINFNGVTDATQRGVTDFYNLQCMPQPVDWAVFGSSVGQGLTFSLLNPDAAVAAFLYIAIWGDAADVSLIGQR